MLPEYMDSGVSKVGLKKGGAHYAPPGIASTPGVLELIAYTQIETIKAGDIGNC